MHKHDTINNPHNYKLIVFENKGKIRSTSVAKKNSMIKGHILFYLSMS